MSDVWEIPYLNPKARERTGFPTQKPILLLEKIISLSSDKGDIILDPFCGSGTTLVAAKILNRKYIGFDILKDAVELSSERLKAPIRTESVLLKKGKSAYQNQCEDILEYLESINAYPVQRNKGIDGFVKLNDEIKPIPVKVQRNHESLKEAKSLLMKACEKNKYEKKVLISDEIKKERQDKKNDLYFFPKGKVSWNVIEKMESY